MSDLTIPVFNKNGSLNYDKEDELNNAFIEFDTRLNKMREWLLNKIKNKEKVYVFLELTDYDGYCSAKYLQSKLNDLMEIVGYTSKRNEIVITHPMFQTLLKTNQVLCLDTELVNQKCITNHLVLVSTSKDSVHFKPFDFKNKNPMSTFGLLHLIFNEPIPANKAFWTDSLYYVYKSYYDNWKIWSSRYDIIKQLENDFEKMTTTPNQEFDLNYERKNNLKSNQKLIEDLVNFKTTQKTVSKTQFKNNYLDDINEFIDHLNDGIIYHDNKKKNQLENINKLFEKNISDNKEHSSNNENDCWTYSLKEIPLKLMEIKTTTPFSRYNPEYTVNKEFNLIPIQWRYDIYDDENKQWIENWNDGVFENTNDLYNEYLIKKVKTGTQQELSFSNPLLHEIITNDEFYLNKIRTFIKKTNNKKSNSL